MSCPKSFSDVHFPSKASYAEALQKHSESKRVYEAFCHTQSLREQQRSSWCGQIPNEVHQQWGEERTISKQKGESLGEIVRKDYANMVTIKKKLDEEMEVAWKADEPKRILETEKRKQDYAQKKRENEEKARELEEKALEKKAREAKQTQELEHDMRKYLQRVAEWHFEKQFLRNPKSYYIRGEICEIRTMEYLRKNPSVYITVRREYFEHLKERHAQQIEHDARKRLRKEKYEDEVKQAMARLRGIHQ